MEGELSIAHRLSSSLGRRDQGPNQELAIEIIRDNDVKVISTLLNLLVSGNKSIQNDCIKVLYEVGEQKPELITGHLDHFIGLLDHKNNRLQWGAMSAINHISAIKPREVYPRLPVILEAVDNGSVITRDNAVNILIHLCDVKEFFPVISDLLIEQLQVCPENQLPMYAERIQPVIQKPYIEPFLGVLNSRLEPIEKESKRKRILRVIKKVRKP